MQACTEAASLDDCGLMHPVHLLNFDTCLYCKWTFERTVTELFLCVFCPIRALVVPMIWSREIQEPVNPWSHYFHSSVTDDSEYSGLRARLLRVLRIASLRNAVVNSTTDPSQTSAWRHVTLTSHGVASRICTPSRSLDPLMWTTYDEQVRVGGCNLLLSVTCVRWPLASFLCSYVIKTFGDQTTQHYE